MLIKLLKYEFKATARVFVFLYCLFAGLTGLVVISAGLSGFSETAWQILKVLLMFGIIAFFPVMIGLVCLMVATVLMRFGKNLLGDEGYIMHTLPASTEKLILSKAIVSVFWTVATCIVLGLCCCVMALDFALLSADNIRFSDFMNAAVYNISASDLIHLVKEIILILAVELMLLVKTYLLIYASMAIGYGFNSFRRAKSLGIFVVINYLLAYVTAGIYKVFDISSSILSLSDVASEWYKFFVYNGIIAAIMFFITAYFLKNRLNLQ